jgi:hypothetical protein
MGRLSVLEWANMDNDMGLKLFPKTKAKLSFDFSSTRDTPILFILTLIMFN